MMTLKQALERIEELEYELAELKGTSDGAALNFSNLRKVLKLEPHQIRTLIFLSDGRPHRYDSFYVIGESNYVFDYAKTIVCRLRKRGFKITTIHGFGYQLEAETAARIRALMKGTVPCQSPPASYTSRVYDSPMPSWQPEFQSFNQPEN